MLTDLKVLTLDLYSVWSYVFVLQYNSVTNACSAQNRDMSYLTSFTILLFPKEGVGLVALNDAIYLECCVYHILRKYCRHKTYYVDIVDLFHQVKTVILNNVFWESYMYIPLTVLFIMISLSY